MTSNETASWCSFAWLVLKSDGSIEDGSSCLAESYRVHFTGRDPERFRSLFEQSTVLGRDSPCCGEALRLDIAGSQVVAFAFVLAPDSLLLRFVDPFGAFALDRDLLSVSFALTCAELDVLEQLTLGRSAPTIAGELARSPHTVRAQLRSIYDKIGVDNKVDAVRVAIATRRECPNRVAFCDWKGNGRR